MRSALAASLQRRVARRVVGTGLRRRLELLAERQALHQTIRDPERIARLQIELFNEIWRGAAGRFRFYADWKRRHGLPDAIADLAELRSFPILRKAEIEASAAIIAEDAAPCRFIATGGTSGPSIRFPRGPEDRPPLHSNMYLGRSWAGIRPGDDIVMIWGHDHLYGFGLRGRIAKAKRRGMDWLIGTRRLDVYRLDEDSAASYFEAIRARPGTVVVGYASALRKLMDFAEQAGLDPGAASIRAVIFCSETVFPSDPDRVRRVLGSTPLIEYGMAETGVMAYSRPEDGALTFFWDAFHCHLADQGELVITTLQRRRFPLINYGTGDRAEPRRDVPPLPFQCARISGRTRDLLAFTLRDGRVIERHSELIEDCLDLVPEVRSYFVHQKDDVIDIAVQADAGRELAEIRRRFLDVVATQIPGLDGSTIIFSRLRREPRTIAGKRQYVLREGGPRRADASAREKEVDLAAD